MFFSKPNYKKLRENKNYEELGKLLFHRKESIRIESAKTIVGLLAKTDTGNEHTKKYNYVKVFNGINDNAVLKILISNYKEHKGNADDILVLAILYANGFPELMNILSQDGKKQVKGNWKHFTLTKYLFMYAHAKRMGLDIFTKIIVHGGCQICEEYLDAYEYVKTHPNAVLAKEEIEKIKVTLEQRENEDDGQNAIVSSRNRMDKLLLAKFDAV